MKRREALKSITLSSGMILTSGTIMSILQACSAHGNENNWQPQFFSSEQGSFFRSLCDFLLPATDTPGGLDVGVPQIVDILLMNVYEAKYIEQFTHWFKVLDNEYFNVYKKSMKESTEEERQAFFKGLYSLSPENAEQIEQLLMSKPPPKKNRKYQIYDAMHSLRNAIIDAYCTSEEIGEKVLTYDPIPGAYNGCIPVSEVKNVWSL